MAGFAACASLLIGCFGTWLWYRKYVTTCEKEDRGESAVGDGLLSLLGTLLLILGIGGVWLSGYWFG